METRELSLVVIICSDQGKSYPRLVVALSYELLTFVMWLFREVKHMKCHLFDGQHDLEWTLLLMVQH